MALSVEELRKVVSYDPLTGIMVWLIDARNNAKAGTEAGYIDGNGRRLFQYGLEVHHYGPLVWFYMTGKWPDGVVDHRDRNPLNNKWDNLRDVTQAVNCQNRSIGVNNTSGCKGVYFNKDMGKWHAQITLNKKKRHLGLFVSFEAAVEARVNAENALFINI